MCGVLKSVDGRAVRWSASMMTEITAKRLMFEYDYVNVRDLIGFVVEFDGKIN